MKAGINILVVSSNPDRRRMISTVLSNSDIGVVFQLSCTWLAQAFLNQDRPRTDVALIDGIAEGMDAFRFVMAVRHSTSSSLRRMPIFVLVRKGQSETESIPGAQMLSIPFVTNHMVQRLSDSVWMGPDNVGARGINFPPPQPKSEDNDLRLAAER